MPIVHTKTTYLEVLHPPGGELAPPRADVRVERVVSPSCEFYRHLYSSVGGDLCWIDRLVMPEEQLQAILSDAQIEVSVLYVAGEAAGYSELDRRNAHEFELVYFGLFPNFIGQGLGKYFLDWTLRRAWASKPDRVWVHTCDLDHPAALPTYLKSGFRIYDEKIVAQSVPEE
jgi:GNAT superfamily N-acetyltransferase